VCVSEEEEDINRHTPPMHTHKNAETTLGAPRASSPGYVFIYLSGDCSSSSGSSGSSAYSAGTSDTSAAHQSLPPPRPPLIVGATVLHNSN
jgi:hypothetical protein